MAMEDNVDLRKTSDIVHWLKDSYKNTLVGYILGLEYSMFKPANIQDANNCVMVAATNGKISLDDYKNNFSTPGSIKTNDVNASYMISGYIMFSVADKRTWTKQWFSLFHKKVYNRYVSNLSNTIKNSPATASLLGQKKQSSNKKLKRDDLNFDQGSRKKRKVSSHMSNINDVDLSSLEYPETFDLLEYIDIKESNCNMCNIDMDRDVEDKAVTLNSDQAVSIQERNDNVEIEMEMEAITTQESNQKHQLDSVRNINISAIPIEEPEELHPDSVLKINTPSCYHLRKEDHLTKLQQLRHDHRDQLITCKHALELQKMLYQRQLDVVNDKLDHYEAKPNRIAISNHSNLKFTDQDSLELLLQYQPTIVSEIIGNGTLTYELIYAIAISNKIHTFCLLLDDAVDGVNRICNYLNHFQFDQIMFREWRAIKTFNVKYGKYYANDRENRNKTYEIRYVVLFSKLKNIHPTTLQHDDFKTWAAEVTKYFPGNVLDGVIYSHATDETNIQLLLESLPAMDKSDKVLEIGCGYPKLAYCIANFLPNTPIVACDIGSTIETIMQCEKFTVVDYDVNHLN